LIYGGKGIAPPCCTSTSSDNVISREPSSKISPASARTPWITAAAPLPNLRLGFTNAFQRQGAVFSKNKNSNFPSLEKCRAGKTRELFKTSRSSSRRNFFRSTKCACSILDRKSTRLNSSH